MRRTLALLVLGSLACWLVLAYPAWRWGGEATLAFSAVAGLLCLVPSSATLVWAWRAQRGVPEEQLIAVLGGTAVRMGVVVAAGMAIYHGFPYFHHQSFWLWVIAFYLFTLTLEMSLLLTRHRRDAARPGDTQGRPSQDAIEK